MATLVGKVGMVAKGDWSNSATYEVLDVVSYSGGLYVAKQNVPANTAPTNTTYWQAAIDTSSFPNVASFGVGGNSNISFSVERGSIIVFGRGSLSLKAMYFVDNNGWLVEIVAPTSSVTCTISNDTVTIANGYNVTIQITVITRFSTSAPT